jgi:hypothetical protein
VSWKGDLMDDRRLEMMMRQVELRIPDAEKSLQEVAHCDCKKCKRFSDVLSLSVSSLDFAGSVSEEDLGDFHLYTVIRALSDAVLALSNNDAAGMSSFIGKLTECIELARAKMVMHTSACAISEAIKDLVSTSLSVSDIVMPEKDPHNVH